METKANYALLGGVAVGAVALIMLFALWLAGVNVNREFATYDLVFEGPARGIGAGTEVRFNGIRVGEVRRLFMNPQEENRVVARIRIGSSWPIRSDSAARLEPIGLTGLNLIQISSGEGKGALLRQRMGEGPPKLMARGAAFDELLESSETIAQNATEAIAGAKDMLTPENAARLERILRNLEAVSRTLAAERGVLQSSNEAAKELRAAARQFAATSLEVELLARDVRGSVSRLDAGATTTLGSVSRAADDVGVASSTAAYETIPELTAAATDMRRLAVTLDRVAGNVERSTALASVGEPKPVVRVRP